MTSDTTLQSDIMLLSHATGYVKHHDVRYDIACATAVMRDSGAAPETWGPTILRLIERINLFCMLTNHTDIDTWWDRLDEDNNFLHNWRNYDLLDGAVAWLRPHK